MKTFEIKNKPDIPIKILEKWQRIVNLMGDITNTPAALITRISPKHIENLLSSDHPNNPFETNESIPRYCGLYCDEVLRSKELLLVKNAYLNEKWNNNPDLEFEMSFYLGYPLIWPDKELFGTICVLDKVYNEEAIQFRDLIEEFQNLVCDDLTFLYQLEQQQNEKTILKLSLKKKRSEIEKRNTEFAEISTAFRVLLKHKKEDLSVLREESREELLLLLSPYLDQLQNSDLSKKQQHALNGLKENLSTDKDSQCRLDLSKLTHSERKIARFIQQNIPSKTIADSLNVEKSTVDFHRRNIRKKLDLTNSNISLQQYFLSLTIKI